MKSHQEVNLSTVKRTKRLIQAYRQAPWRQQLQLIGLFAAAVVSVALVAGLYLNVTARAAAYGREIQEIRSEMRELERINEDLESQLAHLTSASVMTQRAEALGYQPINRYQVLYIEVGGYGGRTPPDLSPSKEASGGEGAKLPAEFTLSLIEWLDGMVNQLALQMGAPVEGARP